MVRPVVKSVSTMQSAGVTYLPEHGFCPSDHDWIGIAVDVEIGPQGERGAEIFRLNVCNAAYLKVEAAKYKHVWLRSYLLVDTWDLAAIRAHIERLCTTIDKPTWAEVGAELDRYMDWEFHDYLPGAH